MQAGFCDDSALTPGRALPEKERSLRPVYRGFSGFRRACLAGGGDGYSARDLPSLSVLLEDLLFGGFKTEVRVSESAFVAPPPHLTDLVRCRRRWPGAAGRAPTLERRHPFLLIDHLRSSRHRSYLHPGRTLLPTASGLAGARRRSGQLCRPDGRLSRPLRRWPQRWVSHPLPPF